jgi:hypothetical protein
MKNKLAIATKLLFVFIFLLSFSNCRSLTGQRETKKEKDIRYQQNKIEEERENNGTAKF